jgi:single stranded DNA-binding protein
MLRMPARTTPVSGVSLSALGADLSVPGLIGAQSKGWSLGRFEQLRKVSIMKNTVTLVGFVGNTPEVRTTQSGASITSLSLATTNSFKDSEGNRQTETEWHRITCFNGVGKCVAEHVAKGAMIMVTGRIHYYQAGPIRTAPTATAARSSPSRSTSSPRRRKPAGRTQEAALEVAPQHHRTTCFRKKGSAASVAGPYLAPILKYMICQK